MSKKGDFAIVIVPQKQVGPYNLDFGIFVKCKHEIFNFDVECDGKEFRSGSVEILEHDRKRDNYVKQLGYYIWRVTGKEINQNPLRAAQLVTEQIGELIEYKRNQKLSVN